MMGEIEVVGGSGTENGRRRWKDNQDNMEDAFEGIEWEGKLQHHTLVCSIGMRDRKACSSCA